MDVDPSEGGEAYPSSPPSSSTQATLPSRSRNGKHVEGRSPSKASAPQTTLKLEEQQMQKFNDYIDEILDAEDTASPEYFIQPSDESHTGTPQSILLQSSCMRKISKSVRALVKTSSGKRIFEQQVDVDHMTRLLAILQRSIEVVENLDIVPAALKKGKGKGKKSPSKTPKKAKKGKKGDSVSPLPSNSRRRSSRSATPASYCEDDDEKDEDEKDSEQDAEDEPQTPSSRSRPKLKGRASTSSISKGRKGSNRAMEAEDFADFEWDEHTISELESNLTALRHAIIASDTVMTILGSANLPKQLYSEDLINLGLSVLKTQLASVIYPALDPERSPLGPGPLDEGIATLIRKVLTAASSTFLSITNLLKQEDATDTTIINAVYIAIAPFFNEPGVKNKAKDVSGSLEMKVVRSQALGIIRTVSCWFK